MTKTDTYEIRDQRFARSVKIREPLEKIWTGGKWLEGPVYLPASRSLVWSDIPNDRRLRWCEMTGAVGEIRAGQNAYANGSTIDREGRIVCAEHGSRSITRVEHDGSIKTLVDRYEGKQFNSPNDVVVRSDDTVWFTDPAYGIETDYEGFQAEPEQDGQHVYRFDPASGECTRVTHDFTCPNGLAFSVDEQTLYIVDSGASRYPDGPRHIRKFAVSESGTLSSGEVFAECEAGTFDGFRLDTKGNIWTSAHDGVHCYDPDGTLIGKIFVPEVVSNLCFGGLKRNRLFMTATSSVYTVMLPTTGVALF